MRRGLKVLAAILLLALLGLFGLAWSRSDLTQPVPSLLVLDRHGAFLGQLSGGDPGDLGYWPVQHTPERVAAAIIAIEDQRFAQHPGVDPLAVGRALWQRLQGSGRSGASTIAMQVARMQNPGPRTLWRKGLEAATAIIMTQRHGRAAVLRHYLQLMPFGNGSHGIAHAARWYLDKPVEDLSWAEIAFLCAIPQSPAHANPFTYSGHQRAVRRGHAILAALRRDGLLSDNDFALAEAQIEALAIPHREHRPPETLHALFHLRQDLQANQGRQDPLIESSLDLDMQRQVQAMTRDHLSEWRERGAEQASVVVLDRRSREVLAWVGSGDYFSKAAGAMDFATVSRSPGSALKPFLYALGLERGRINANSIMADLPDSIWGIENADHDYLGPMLPRQALANSRNVPAAWLVRQEGLDEAYLFLHDLGLHDNIQASSRFGLVLAVGALPTTLERLVQAYGALADDGRLKPLRWRLDQPTTDGRQVMSEAVARQVTLFLADPAARLPSFPRLGATEDGLPIAVKTGTSQGYRDAWAVAWTRRYLVGVWTGRARGSAMRSVSGGQSSAKLAQTVLVALHRQQGDIANQAAFPPPQGYKPVELCARTGLRSAGRCAQTLTEWFADGQTPEEDDVFQHLRIDLRNNLLAAPWTPAIYVSERTFAALPPEQTAWGAANNLPQPPQEISPLDHPERKQKPMRTATIPGAVPDGNPSPALLAVQQTGKLTITAPRDGLRMMRNPEMPPEANQLNLRLAASNTIGQVVWLVDGTPLFTGPPQTPVHWPLTPGPHRFEAATPDGSIRSNSVSIQVE